MSSYIIINDIFIENNVIVYSCMHCIEILCNNVTSNQWLIKLMYF